VLPSNWAWVIQPQFLLRKQLHGCVSVYFCVIISLVFNAFNKIDSIIWLRQMHKRLQLSSETIRIVENVFSAATTGWLVSAVAWSQLGRLKHNWTSNFCPVLTGLIVRFLSCLEHEWTCGLSRVLLYFVWNNVALHALLSINAYGNITHWDLVLVKYVNKLICTQHIDQPERDDPECY